MQRPLQHALLLDTLERLLEIPSAELATALTHACDAVSKALQADKVDAFLFDASRASLVAVGTSNQPTSALQRRVGLDVLPIANGGRIVEAFESGTTVRLGRVIDDPLELKGIRETLKIDSHVCVPLEVGGRLRGVLAVGSLQRDFFTDEDCRFVESVARWIGTLAHRAELVEEIAKNAVEQGRRAAAEELVTVLAHDLRNLLAPISGRLQILRHRAGHEARDADVRDCDAATAAVERLERMVSDMLDVARIDHGMMRLEFQPIDLAAAATAVAATLSTPEHEVCVRSSEEVTVSADPARVTQCLENLVSNAIRHSPRGAAVTVLVRKRSQDDREVGLVEVLDEGPGIPIDLLPRIFDRYTTGPGSSGLGLGLYLARRIAAAHEGNLSVDSPPGKGARFRLELPVA